jgi:uncharacterized protein YwbE
VTALSILLSVQTTQCIFRVTPSYKINFVCLSVPLTVSQFLSRSVSSSHGLSVPLTVSQFLSRSLSFSQGLSVPLTVSQFLSRSVSSSHGLSVPLTVSQFLSRSVSSSHGLSVLLTVFTTSRYLFLSLRKLSSSHPYF